MSLILSALQKLETASGGNEDAPIWHAPIEPRPNGKALRHRSGRRVGAALLSTLTVICLGVAGYVLAGYWEGRSIDEKRALRGDLMKPVATAALSSTRVVNSADSLSAETDISASNKKATVNADEGKGQAPVAKPSPPLSAASQIRLSQVTPLPKPTGTEKVSRRPSLPAKTAINRKAPATPPSPPPERTEPSVADETLPDAEGLTLMAVSWSDHRENRLAVINGRIVREGGRIEGHDVLRIAAEQVVLGFNGRRLQLVFEKR